MSDKIEKISESSMEEIGGGGHLTTAGAQVEGEPAEVIQKVRELAVAQLEKTGN